MARTIGKRPRWHLEAVKEYMRRDVSQAALAVELGVSKRRMEEVLASPWAREIRRDIETRTRARLVEQGVDPVVQCQMAGPEMAATMIQAARDEAKPYPKALIAKEVLALGGWQAVSKSEHRHLHAHVDLGGLSDDELARWADQGIVPDKLKGRFLAAPAEEETDATQARDE